MHLTDPRFRHAENLTDFSQGETLVVVEGDDNLLALGQTLNCLREDDFGLFTFERPHRIGCVLIFQSFTERALVAAVRTGIHQHVKSHNVDELHLIKDRVKLIECDTHLLSHLGLSGCSLELCLERLIRTFHIAGLGAD